MKSKKAGKARRFTVVIERDEDGIFVASVPALRGCHAQGKSLDQVMRRIREAFGLCLEVERASRTVRFPIPSYPILLGAFVPWR
jgi:predicted RNase H-like HicB family nuclease